MGKVMRHTLGASLNIRHNLSSSKGPKPLQLKLLTTYIPKTSAFTLAFSTSQRLRTTRASARTFFTFRHYITPSYAWERAGADASSAGMVDAGFENQKELTKMQLDNQKEIAEMQNETQKEIAGIQSATSRQN